MTLSLSRRLILLVAAASLLAAALFATSQAPLGAEAHAASQRTCKLSYNKYPRYPTYRGKGGYFTSLRVTNTSCLDGKRQMLAWYRCRIAKGLTGRCTQTKVRGYRCTERRGSVQSGAGGSEFSARVTCNKTVRVNGRNVTKKIVHTYDQEVANR